ncbi:MAG TPA: lysophospholipid acyltransferase family protein [Candidatus Aminicenantes bacterium]|nr:lysophospholipid acyltransferase family protein [Candidatus Aminicenantes bacterium]
MKKAGERLLSLLIWAAALPVFVAGCVSVWSCSFLLRGRALESLIKAACRAVIGVCGIRLRVSGGENFVPGRQYIVMMNHINFFDPLVFYAAFPGMARGIEEESHFHWPVYGGTIRRIGMFPISRSNTQRAVESLRRAARWIRSRPEFSLAILPEGTRTRDGRLGAFKRGGFLLAIDAELDILPIVQTGALKIARKGSLLIRPGRVDMAIAPAIPTAGYAKENVGELVERVRKAFESRLAGREPLRSVDAPLGPVI